MSAPPITERHRHHFHRQSPIKESVRVATTANGTLASAFENGDTVDGVTLATGDRILLKDQSTGSQNGIHTVNASGAPTRAYDQSSDDPAYGFLVYVREGTTNGGVLFTNTNTAAPTIGSTSLTFDEIVAPGASLPWFVLTDYGAVGDGTTDDTAAVNLAIAALNSAGRGVLYAPAGRYKTSGALTTITAGGMVLGDGMASYDDAQYGSEITCTSQTAVLFTVSSKAFRFEGLSLVNTYAGTPSAGAAILSDSSYLEQRVDYEGCSFQGFYDNVDVKVGAQWSMRGCFVIAPVRYGVRIRNTVNPDAGDWAISDTNFSAQTYNSTSAIRVESSGGGKILGCKINTALDAKKFATGIDVAITTGSTTSVLLVTGNSIENVSGDGINITTTGTGRYGHVVIAGNQVGLYSNNTGFAVKLVAASTGGFTASGGLGPAVIDGCVFYTDGTARAAVSLTNTDRVTLGDYAIQGFTSRYTSSGDTNTTDAGAGTTPAPVGADYLVGTANGTLTSEIVVGTTPSGELGGTWASPTIDSTHSGSAHTDFVAKSVATTKGDLLAATASATIARVGVGTDGQYLKADSGATAGVSWADLPAASTTSSGSDHEHMVDAFAGDGATTAFELTDEPIDPEAVVAFVAGAETAVTMSGTLNTTATFGVAPGAAARVVIQYPAYAA